MHASYVNVHNVYDPNQRQKIATTIINTYNARLYFWNAQPYCFIHV